MDLLAISRRYAKENPATTPETNTPETTTWDAGQTQAPPANPLTATTATPPATAPSALGTWGVGGGLLAVLVGAVWGVWALAKKKPKKIPGAILAAGVLAIVAATRDANTRQWWGEWCAGMVASGGVGAVVGRIVGVFLGGFGVKVPTTIPAAASSQPPITTTPPAALPPAPAIEQGPPAAILPGDVPDGPILIDPVRVDQAHAAGDSLQKRAQLRWPDGRPPAEVLRAAESLRARVYNGAPDELMGAFTAPVGLIGAWWATEASSPRNTDPAAVAVRLAQAWAASVGAPAYQALGISNLGLGMMEFEGKYLPYRVQPLSTRSNIPTK